MANRLKKRTEALLISPGRGGSPYTPAYCSTLYRAVEVVSKDPNGKAGALSGGGASGEESGGAYTSSIYTNGAAIARNATVTFNPDGSVTITKWPITTPSRSKSNVKKVWEPYTQCFPSVPAVPATPPTYQILGEASWDGGARSFRSFEGSAEYSFRVPRSVVGVISGLSDGAPVRAYDHVAHGFLFETGQPVRIIESGVTVATLADVSLASGPRFSVRRLGNEVSYCVDGTLVYLSAQPSAGPVYAEALLYSAADYVDNPQFAALQAGELEGRVPPPLGTIGDSTATQIIGRVPMPMLMTTLRLRGVVGVHGRVPPHKIIASDGPYAAAGGNLPRTKLQAALKGPIVISSRASGTVPTASGASVLLCGALGSVGQRMPALQGMIADRPYGAAGGVWPTSGYYMDAWQSADGPGEITAYETLMTADWAMAFMPFMLVTIRERMEVGAGASILIIDHAHMDEYLALGSYIDLAGQLHVALRDGLSVGDSLAPQQDEALSYAVNLVTGAVAEYSDWGFSHYADTQGQLWACRPDGLYRLGGGDSPINALVDFGVSDLDSVRGKSCDVVFMGLRTDGEVYLRVIADGTEVVYRAITRGGDMYRATLAKGIRARQWNLQLEIQDASFATVDSVEMRVAGTQRFSGGRR